MPISEARDHISELVGRARYSHEATILTHYGSPAAVVISFEEYQKLKHVAAAGRARGTESEEARTAEDEPEYQLPPEIEAQIEEGRRHPERGVPYQRRTKPRQGA